MTEPTVSVVMPVYNEERHLGATLEALAVAAQHAPGFVAEVIVVDDGSTDDSAAIAERATGLDLRVIRQGNAGRYLARLRGLNEAGSELVLFLDARVRLDPAALAFVQERIHADSANNVWNGHVRIEADTSYARFWNVLTDLAFSAYFDNPQTTSFDADTFDSYPKGTGCFLAPRELIIAASEFSISYYADLRNANDDTLILRHLAGLHRIAISPQFSCRYRSRDSLVPFLRHAYHRGVHFLDGHGRAGARLAPVVAAFYPMSVLFGLLALTRPRVAAATIGAGGLSAGALSVAKRRSPSESVSFALLVPVYAAAHGLGMWRGLLHAVQSRRKARGR